MGKHVRRMIRKGKVTVLLDARGLQEEEYLVAWDEMEEELLKDREGSLVLVNATGAAMTAATVNRAKQMAAAVEAAGIPDRSTAFVGLTGLQKSTETHRERSAYECAFLQHTGRGQRMAGQGG